MKSGGHKLGSSVLDSEPRWRCEVCTFLNGMAAAACGRCREPVDDDGRERMRVRVERPPAAAAAAAEGKPAAKVWKRRTQDERRGEVGKKPAAAGKRKMGGVGGSKPAASSVRRTQFGGAHKGDLGYTPAKGGNIRTTTRSRLTEATASYAAKFEKEGDGKPRKSANIHTVGDSKVNGLTKSSAAVKAERVRYESRNAHDSKPAPRPAKYSKGGGLGARQGGNRQKGLIGRLQQAATSAAVASLKHTKRTVAPSVKVVNGQATKLAL